MIHPHGLNRHATTCCASDAAKYGSKDKAYRLVTLGADGRVLMWLWHKLDAPVYGWVAGMGPGLEQWDAYASTSCS